MLFDSTKTNTQREPESVLSHMWCEWVVSFCVRKVLSHPRCKSTIRQIDISWDGRCAIADVTHLSLMLLIDIS